VEPPTAQFALRLALFEFDKFVRDGLSKEDFERWRNFVSKNINLLVKTKSAELGYAIDSVYYGIPEYGRYVREGLAKLTVEDVNRAIRRHLQTKNLQVVVVAKGCEELKQRFLSNAPSPMTYNSPKPSEILEEDKLVERFKIDWDPTAVKVLPVDGVFE